MMMTLSDEVYRWDTSWNVFCWRWRYILRIIQKIEAQFWRTQNQDYSFWYHICLRPMCKISHSSFNSSIQLCPTIPCCGEDSTGQKINMNKQKIWLVSILINYYTLSHSKHANKPTKSQKQYYLNFLLQLCSNGFETPYIQGGNSVPISNIWGFNGIWIIYFEKDWKKIFYRQHHGWWFLKMKRPK